MSALDQLETFLQELLDRPAWLLSSRRLQPIQLAGAIARELDERALRLPDRIVVPDSYVVSLASDDFAPVETMRATLERELAQYVERLAAERDLSLPGDPQVRICADPSLRPGHIVAHATITTAGRAETPLSTIRRATHRTAADIGAAEAPSLMLLGQDGGHLRTFTLQPPAVSVGRRSDNDIALADLKVSRHHAELGAKGRDWYLADLGSTNGTRVNGDPLSGRRKLKSGDIIEMGFQRLRFQQ